jgi:hypothetical protein
MPALFLTKAPKTYDGEKVASSTFLLGKVVICLQKTEIRPLPVTEHYLILVVLVSTQSGLRTLISDLKPYSLYRKEQGIF